ncbi:hypothetical protein ACOMHN_001369 [Nucella lapillus]
MALTQGGSGQDPGPGGAPCTPQTATLARTTGTIPTKRGMACMVDSSNPVLVQFDKIITGNGATPTA